jgi:16S rRNA G966 N2-methylase RsmD
METLIKLTFISGLKDVVLQELAHRGDIQVIEEDDDSLYIDNVARVKDILALKGVTNIYIIRRDQKLNPRYISNHKSILGELLKGALDQNPKSFKTFKLRCAGIQTEEVGQIQEYIKDTFKLTPSEDADMEVYIHKPNTLWEVGVRLTPRPLSVREYKVEHIKGGINPTVAYAMNSFCDLERSHSYLNVCSGSATLLIEAAGINKNLKLLGFDNNNKHNSQAIQNIKKAGLITLIQIKSADVFDSPDFGMFDVITSDLPFGMQISKDEDLKKLYKAFVTYCEDKLNKEGTLAVYTSEWQLLKDILEKSKFAIIKTLNFKLSTSVGSYIYPKAFVCKKF